MLDILLLQGIAGINIPLSKFMLLYTAPCAFAASRLLLSAFLCIVYEAHYHIPWSLQTLSVDTQWLYVRMVFLGVYLKYICKYWSLQHLSTMQASFLFCFTPCIAAYMECVLAGKKITMLQWIAIGVAFFSITVFFICSIASFSCLGSVLMMLVAICAHCYNMICARRLIYEYSQNPDFVVLVQLVTGGLLCLSTSYLCRESICNGSVLSLTGGFLVIAINGALYQKLYAYSIERYSVTMLTMSDYIGCLWSIFYSRYLLNEVIMWEYSIVFCIVIGALYAFYQEEQRVRVVA